MQDVCECEDCNLSSQAAFSMEHASGTSASRCGLDSCYACYTWSRMDVMMQESTLIATKLLSDAGLQVRMNSQPEAATLMTHAQPGFFQLHTPDSSPTAQASPAASPTSANALPLSLPAAIRGSPSDCGANRPSPSMSRTSSVGMSGFLATPLSAESLASPMPAVLLLPCQILRDLQLHHPASHGPVECCSTDNSETVALAHALSITYIEHLLMVADVCLA